MCLAVFQTRKISPWKRTPDPILRFADVWGVLVWWLLNWFGWHIDGFCFIHIYHPDAIDSFRAFTLTFTDLHGFFLVEICVLLPRMRYHLASMNVHVPFLLNEYRRIKRSEPVSLARLLICYSVICSTVCIFLIREVMYKESYVCDKLGRPL
jgi:hypothetical protein